MCVLLYQLVVFQESKSGMGVCYRSPERLITGPLFSTDVSPLLVIGIAVASAATSQASPVLIITKGGSYTLSVGQSNPNISAVSVRTRERAIFRQWQRTNGLYRG